MTRESWLGVMSRNLFLRSQGTACSIDRYYEPKLSGPKHKRTFARSRFDGGLGTLGIPGEAPTHGKLSSAGQLKKGRLHQVAELQEENDALQVDSTIVLVGAIIKIHDSSPS